MDVMSLLTSSENLYKYLLVGGISLVILSLFYPIDKRYELSVKKNQYNNEVGILNFEIDNLKKRATKLKELAKETEIAIKEKRRAGVKGETSDIIKLKENYGNQLDSAEADEYKISIKDIEIKYHRELIKTLDTNISNFLKYELIFFWFGVIFSICGIIGWFILMKKGMTSP